MTRSKVVAFRERLAEQGKETTPEEAVALYKHVRKFVRRAKSMSMKDIWAVESENPQFAELYRKAKEA